LDKSYVTKEFMLTLQRLINFPWNYREWLLWISVQYRIWRWLGCYQSCYSWTQRKRRCNRKYPLRSRYNEKIDQTNAVR